MAPARMPWWAWALPLAAAAVVIAETTRLLPAKSVLAIALAAPLLIGTIFASVHHAEIVALRVGEPFGSVILAAAVTVIEVSLILSIMLAAPEASTQMARDTVFAAVMIVLNGVVGICLMSGGLRYREQGFQVHGAAGALGVLGALATLTLILPNYTKAVPGPVFSPAQLVFVAVVSLALYGLFLFVQTVRHREYFLDAGAPMQGHVAAPSNTTTLVSLALLIVALAAVVLLAEGLSPAVQRLVFRAGLPPAFVGVVIAAVVLMPEGLAALRAARANRLQTSLNLALGSALASIGLTIPAVAIVSLTIGTPLALGLEAEHIVLLVLTLFSATLTLATGRTTLLQGGVHLVIFAAFVVIAAVP